jgi:hypothetical protein
MHGEQTDNILAELGLRRGHRVELRGPESSSEPRRNAIARLAPRLNLVVRRELRDEGVVISEAGGQGR